MVQQEIKRKTRAYGLAAVTLSTILAVLIYSLGVGPTTPSVAPSSPPPSFSPVPPNSYPTPSTTPTNEGPYETPEETTLMKSFASYDELKSFLANYTPSGYYYFYGGGPLDAKFRSTISPPVLSTVTGAVPMQATAASQYGVESDYSTTNIQVAGVDEADIVKTDGMYIYVIAKNSLYILNADPQNAKVLSKTAYDNNTYLAGIFISQDGKRLVALGSTYTYSVQILNVTDADGKTYSYPYEYIGPLDVRTFIHVYDVSDKTKPTLVRNITALGSYFNSRMIGDYVYVVISQPVYLLNDTVPLPVIMDNSKEQVIEPTRIHYVDVKDNYYTFTTFMGISVTDDTLKPSTKTVMMGGASEMYVSLNNIYVTYPSYNEAAFFYGGVETEVYRISIKALTLRFEAHGRVPGTVINQFSMDEYAGYFRAATNSWFNGTQQNNVYVLDMNLTIVGKLENIATGENLHSARFMGDKCYLVTFKKTDPLFVISLADPAKPTVLGQLKIPGYSDYLHPYDESHLIGVGKETVEAEEGDFAWYQGIKLSLFDVSDVNNPKQLAKYVIGDRGTDSLILTDHKAFLFSKTKDLLVIPVNLAVIDKTTVPPSPSAYGTFVWQGAMVFKLTLTDGFVLRGNITHVEGKITSNDQSYWGSSDYWITRALYIGNVLYTVSNAKVELNNLDTLAPIAQIPLK